MRARLYTPPKVIANSGRTSNIVTAEMIFWRNRLYGMMLYSIVLPLAFSSVAATIFVEDMSSCANPWDPITARPLRGAGNVGPGERSRGGEPLGILGFNRPKRKDIACLHYESF